MRMQLVLGSSLPPPPKSLGTRLQQRRYERVIGVTICTAHKQYVYLGVYIYFVTVHIVFWTRTAIILFTATSSTISIPIPSAVAAMGRKMHYLYDLFILFSQYAQLLECNYVCCLIASSLSLLNLL